MEHFDTYLCNAVSFLCITFLQNCLIKQAYPQYLGNFVPSHPLVIAILVALQPELGYHHFVLLEDLALDWVFVVEGLLVYDGVVGHLVLTALLRKGAEISYFLGNV